MLESMLRSSLLLLSVFGLAAQSLLAVEYHCRVFRKVSFEIEYSQEELNKWQFTVKLEENDGKAFLSRCSYSVIDGEITCDRHRVDRVEYDPNPKVKKYYVFQPQFDFQLFPSLKAVENNGRGDIAFARCEVVSP